MRAFDIGQVLGLDELRTLKAAGYDAMIPYLDPVNAKGCTAQYLRDIAAAGLVVPGFWYETEGGAISGPSYFSEDQGRADAGHANELLARFFEASLIPARAIVWYAVDVDVDPPILDPYFNGVAAVADSALQIPGLYGWQRHCEYVRAAYPDVGRHLAQTYGTVSGELDVWQHLQTTVDGITVDEDDVSVPGWTPGGDMTPDQVNALVAQYLATVYGPALEAELAQRFADAAAAQKPVDLGAITTAVEQRIASKIAAP